LNQIYLDEQRFVAMIGYFSIFAIFIACLGLFGLVSFMAEQRTKEIGVRKIVGASESSLVLLLSKQFTQWILLSTIIAGPIAYYLMNAWLNGFAYRTNISWWIFIVSGIITLAIAFITVSYQAIKSSRANPIYSLRYE
jgi:putative ABC transport system permease protein